MSPAITGTYNTIKIAFNKVILVNKGNFNIDKPNLPNKLFKRNLFMSLSEPLELAFFIYKASTYSLKTLSTLLKV